MVSIEQIDEKIESLNKLRKTLEEHPELEEYDFLYDKQSSRLEEQIKLIEEYTTFDRAIEYLTARSYLDCHGHPKGHPQFNENRVFTVPQLLDIYYDYLKTFGNSIKANKMPLEPGDVYDVVYHFHIMKDNPSNYVGMINGKVIISIGD